MDLVKTKKHIVFAKAEAEAEAVQNRYPWNASTFFLT
jgi:hypothetical protein